MTKLLRANFSRLFQDTFLWIVCLVCCVFSFAIALSGCESANKTIARGFTAFAEIYLYNLAPMLGLFLAVCLSMFLGVEYADGTIRNKLIVGKTRYAVYLANYLVCFVASLLVMLSWMVGTSGFFLNAQASLEWGYMGILKSVLLLTGVMASFASVYTLIGMLCANKALTVVLSLTVFLVLLLPASGLYDRLGEPEILDGMTIMLDGEFVYQNMGPNPLYLSGMVRKICQTILEILPTGQVILVSQQEVIHPVRQLCFSAVVTVLTLAGGMAAFRKKDLK